MLKQFYSDVTALQFFQRSITPAIPHECSHLFPSMLHNPADEELGEVETEWQSNGLTLDDVQNNSDILRADKKRRMDLCNQALHKGDAIVKEFKNQPIK